jgi:hypothetical protein
VCDGDGLAVGRRKGEGRYASALPCAAARLSAWPKTFLSERGQARPRRGGAGRQLRAHRQADEATRATSSNSESGSRLETREADVATRKQQPGGAARATTDLLDKEELHPASLTHLTNITITTTITITVPPLESAVTFVHADLLDTLRRRRFRFAASSRPFQRGPACLPAPRPRLCPTTSHDCANSQ